MVGEHDQLRAGAIDEPPDRRVTHRTGRGWQSLGRDAGALSKVQDLSARRVPGREEDGCDPDGGLMLDGGVEQAALSRDAESHAKRSADAAVLRRSGHELSSR